MPARKIKVVDVINAIEDHAVEEHVPVPNDTDAGDVKAIENEPIEAIPSGADHEVEVEEETTQVMTPEIPNPEGQTPVSSVKTVELVECPDCNKKMTKKTLKYSHAKNCTGKKVVPAVKEEAEEAEETEEEVIPSPPPQPLKLKRTVSVVPAEKTPVKKTINKVRRDIATEGQVEQQSHTPGASAGVDQRVTVKPTVANIYGREIRNERVKQKTEKMGKLFVNAI